MTSQCHRDVIAAAAAAVSQAYIYACQFYAAFFFKYADRRVVSVLDSGAEKPGFKS